MVSRVRLIRSVRAKSKTGAERNDVSTSLDANGLSLILVGSLA